MAATPDALSLVHEGWDHLKLERPLAAWACWQRALRIEPDQPAARQALDRLAQAPELPASARKEYRFRNPSDPARRARWDAAFRGRDLSDLAVAASAFAGLANEDPTDPDAPYNQALCLAWLGRNAEAIAALDRAVGLRAGSDPEGAAAAWTLAGVLRQGGGAEELADAVRYAVEWEGDPAGRLAALARRGALRRLPPPAEAGRDDVTVDEWLDRDWPEVGEAPLGLADLPRLRGIALATARSLRVSTTNQEGLAAIASALGDSGGGLPPIRQTPLPLALLDADVWTIRVPAGVDDESRRRLYRENVEDYFENRWVHRPRRDLGPSWISPLAAARGDAASRAKLAATIALFEELADRPTARELYQGYPFDRLRRRLGLPPRDAEAVDPADPGSMSGDDLDRLDPGALDDHALADAFRSAAALGDDARTARFADRLVAAQSPALARLDLRDVFAPLVRLALAEDRPEVALRRVDEAIAADAEFRGGRDRGAFTTWRAELHARVGEPDHAEATYRSLVDHSAAAASVALDGAETLLDNGHREQALRLAGLARDIALAHGDVATAREAEALLERLEP